MDYYGYNDFRTYLAHHGILGQKWGVRRFQPYGKGGYRPTGKEKDIAKKRAAVESLSKELNTEWDYGIIINGKKVTNTDNVNWSRDYRTIPIKTLEKEKIGVCWDYVNYQHDRLKKAGINDNSYLLTIDLRTKEDPDRVVTHTFTTFELGGKNYWLESSMWPRRGIHEITDFKDAVNSCLTVYTDKKVNYEVFKYNPEGLDKGLTDQEFFDRVTEDNLILEVKNKKN